MSLRGTFSPVEVLRIPVGSQLEVLSVTYDFIGELTIYLLWRLPGVSPAVVLVVRLTSAYWTGDAWLA